MLFQHTTYAVLPKSGNGNKEVTSESGIYICTFYIKFFLEKHNLWC